MTLALGCLRAALFIAIAALLLATAPARAQTVMQMLGPTVNGHLAMMLGQGGQAIDAGGPVTVNGQPQNSINIGALPTGLGIVNSGLGYCQWTGYANAPYNEFCWGFDGSGNPQLVVDTVGGTPPTGVNLILNGNSTPLGSFGLPVFNVANYGGVCGSLADNGPALTAAARALKANRHGRLVWESSTSCKIATTADLTGLDSAAVGFDQGIIIDIGGAEIDCQTANDVCIDGLVSKAVDWRSLNLSGNCDPTKEPNILFQIGRETPAHTASQHHLGNIQLQGCAKQTLFANFAAEVTHADGGVWRNRDNGPAAYVAVIDCLNHRNWLTSHYQTINWAPDTHASCFSMMFYSTVMQQIGTAGGGSAPAFWADGVDDLTLDRGTYLSSQGNFPIVLFDQPEQPNVDVQFLSHYESIGNKAPVLLSSTRAVPVYQGLTIEDPLEQATFGMTALDFDVGVTLAQINNYTVRTASGGAGFTVFGTHQTVLTATISGAPSSGCGDGSYTFVLAEGLNGTGIDATITGTSTGGVVSGALTVTTGGTYRDTPGATSTLIGDSCVVPPTVTLGYGNLSTAPYTINIGSLKIPVRFNNAASAESGVCRFFTDVGTQRCQLMYSSGLLLNTLVATGMPPVATGSCSINTQHGGNTAGSFLAAGACPSGTVILTFNTSTLGATPTGWMCEVTVSTTMKQTAYSPTSCTLTGSMLNGDLVIFNAKPF